MNVSELALAVMVILTVQLPGGPSGGANADPFLALSLSALVMPIVTVLILSRKKEVMIPMSFVALNFGSSLTSDVQARMYVHIIASTHVYMNLHVLSKEV